MEGDVKYDHRGVAHLTTEQGVFDCVGYPGETRSVYMCATDFEHEVGQAPVVEAYDSLESLRSARGCVSECGWVRVLMVRVERGK